MANTTFYNRGDAYHDSAGNPAIIKRGNELTFTEHFNAGGGGTLEPATANTLGGVKIGEGVNVTSDGTISVNSFDLPTGSGEVLTPYHWVDGNPIYAKRITGNYSQYSTLATGASHIVAFIGYRVDGREYGVNAGDLQIQNNSGAIQYGSSSGGSFNAVLFYSKVAPTRTSKKKG